MNTPKSHWLALPVAIILQIFAIGLVVITCLLLFTGCTSCLTRIEDQTTTGTNGVVIHDTITTEKIRTLFAAKTAIAKGHVSQSTKTNGVTVQTIGVTGFDTSSQDPLGNTNLWRGIGIAARAAAGLPTTP